MIGLCRVLSSSGKQSPLLSDLHVGRWHSRGCCCHPCASAPISNMHQTCWCCARAAGAVSWFSACVISATRLGASYSAAPALHQLQQVMGGCPRPRRVFAAHLGAVLPTGLHSHPQMKCLEDARLATASFLPQTLLQIAYFPWPTGKSASFVHSADSAPVGQVMLVHPSFLLVGKL